MCRVCIYNKGCETIYDRDALVAILGATVDLGIIWGIADTCNGLMSIPNLIALFLLSGTVAKLVKDYFAKQAKKN